MIYCYRKIVNFCYLIDPVNPSILTFFNALAIVAPCIHGWTFPSEVMLQVIGPKKILHTVVHWAKMIFGNYDNWEAHQKNKLTNIRTDLSIILERVGFVFQNLFECSVKNLNSIIRKSSVCWNAIHAIDLKGVYQNNILMSYPEYIKSNWSCLWTCIQYLVFLFI